jgi:hypothetical protein
MKIRDILSEDDAMKIKSVSGEEVTLDQGGQEIKTTTDALTPSADKPGAFAMKPADPNQLKPGAEVIQATSEEYEEEGQETPYFVDMSSGKPMAKSGNGMTPIVGAKWSQLTPEIQTKLDSAGYRTIKVQVNHQIYNGFEGGGKIWLSAPDFQAISVPHQEGHRDLVSQGNQDVGGDATGGAGYKRGFINDVTDKGYERKNRSPGSDGSSSTIGSGKLKESDELMKWLTIAGIR